MHGPAKMEADPRMPVWSARRGLSTNARPNQIPDIESSNVDYESIVQVMQNNDACEFEYSSKFETQVKGKLCKNAHFWRRIGVPPFILRATEEGCISPFFAFQEPAALKYNRSALEHTEIVENALEELCQSGRVIRCATPTSPPPALNVVNHVSVSVQANDKRRRTGSSLG